MTTYLASVQQHPINQVITQFQSFIQQKQQYISNQLKSSTININHGRNVRTKVLKRQQQQMQSAQTYMDARLSGRNDEVLRLVSDNVILTSSRDGRFVGKPSLRDYICRVKASGKWHKPKWNHTLNVAEVEGNVKILLINVPVLAQFGFDTRGKISNINVGTRKKVSTNPQ